MLITGHLAAGVLAVAAVHAIRPRQEDLSPRPRFRSVLLPTLLGTLTPDLIDKPLEWAGVVSSTRSVGHSLWFLAVGAGLAFVLWWWMSRRGGARWMLPPAMWLVGIATHQLVDGVDELLLDHFSRPTPLELALILAALGVLGWWYRPGARGS